MKKAFKADIVRELNKGGVVEFVWKTCKHTLITSDGQRIPMDGRTYSAFVTNPSLALVCSKTGDAEKGDLILVWRKIQGQPDTLIVTPSRASQVNAVLQSVGIREYLKRGTGYWYFDGGNSSSWYSSSVPVYRISAGTIGWWITQWLELAVSDSDYTLKYGAMGSIVLTDVILGDIEVFTNPIQAIRWFIEKTSKFFVTIEGKRQYFRTIEDAQEFASEYFTKHNVVLGIERKK